MTERSKLKSGKRWVVKIGSALLTNDGDGLDLSRMQAWVRQMSALIDDGVELCLVSSGAIAFGLKTLKINQRPQELPLLQAAAAIGQMGLVQAWQSCFSACGRETSQVLLTHEELADRKRYLNARDTLKTLSQFGVIPVVNENDTVATDEIRFGDNDTLAALVTNLIEADLLIILTDVDGLMDADPRTSPDAKRVTVAGSTDPDLAALAGDSVGALGRGGMVTKLRAARLAARSGAHTLIASGETHDVLPRLLSQEDLGTLLTAELTPMTARKRWIAGQLRAKGDLVIDPGAVVALRQQGVSLLAVGVLEVRGDFVRGDVVRCVTAQGETVAQGLINYSSSEAAILRGLSSEEFAVAISYAAEPELMHRDNLVLL